MPKPIFCRGLGHIIDTYCNVVHTFQNRESFNRIISHLKLQSTSKIVTFLPGDVGWNKLSRVDGLDAGGLDVLLEQHGSRMST